MSTSSYSTTSDMTDGWDDWRVSGGQAPAPTWENHLQDNVGNGGVANSEQIQSLQPQLSAPASTAENAQEEYPDETAAVSQSYDPKAADYQKRQEKIQSLKMLRDAGNDLFDAIPSDELLSELFLANYDYICYEKYLEISSDMVPWRTYTHAVFFDLMDFARNESLPKCATPITFLESGILLCITIDKTNVNKELIDRVVSNLVASGTDIADASDITYGSIVLCKQTDADGTIHYYRVVLLSLNNTLDGNVESWSVLCLDDHLVRGRERIFVVNKTEFLCLPDECSLEKFSPLVFLAKLRGLQDVQDGYIEDARKDLQSYLSQKDDDMGMVFNIGFDEGAMLPIIDFLYVDDKVEDVVEDGFLAANLFKAQKQPDGVENKYWVMNEYNELPEVPNFAARLDEILGFFDPETLPHGDKQEDDLPSVTHVEEEINEEELPVDQLLSKEPYSWTPDIMVPIATTSNAFGDQNQIEEKTQAEKFLDVFQSLTTKVAYRNLIKAAFQLCKDEHPNVSDDDFKFFVSCFTNATDVPL